MNRPDSACDFDWIVIGSGFGGSVAALRLVEKGYSVAVLERGRRFRDQHFAATTWNLARYFWAPALGLRGIVRLALFKDIFIGSGAGVGGGSLVYANTLYRAKQSFFEHPQWADLADWPAALGPHYEAAERLLGVQTVPFDSTAQRLLQEIGRHFGVAATWTRTPCAVFFGAPGIEVPDPYFGGAGPARTGCTRCGACMVGCRVGAKNTLVKNYLWFAEEQGARIFADTEVEEIRPLDGDDGGSGYVVATRRPGPWMSKQGQTLRARGVVVAAGALGTNELLARCKHGGALPRLSHRLGQLVRTNSESVLAVTLPDDRLEPWQDVAISSSPKHGARGDRQHPVHRAHSRWRRDRPRCRHRCRRRGRACVRVSQPDRLRRLDLAGEPGGQSQSDDRGAGRARARRHSGESASLTLISRRYCARRRFGPLAELAPMPAALEHPGYWNRPDETARLFNTVRPSRAAFAGLRTEPARRAWN